MRISVIGTGYVGLVSGACFAALGHDCTCVDLDPLKVERINRGEAPIHEQGLPALLAQYVGHTLRATTDLAQAVLTTDITFIAVGTPFDGQRIDLGYVRDAARQVGLALREKPGYHVVVVKSTVVPGTTDEVVLPELERASGRKAGIDFGVGMNPEFLTEGTAIEDFMHPDRIVIGGNDERTQALQREVYAPFRDTPLVATGNTTAEMIKYASNAILATMISFSNEMGNLSSAIGGVDIADVLRGVHLSRYFTRRLEDGRTVEAPITSFLWAGCGYGGSCLPKDTKALAAHGRAIGTPATMPPASTSGSPSRISPTSALVPPISILSARSKPAMRATNAAPATPPAGPDSASDAAERAASVASAMPPPDPTTPGEGKPSAFSRSASRRRYAPTPGRAYASQHVVAVRSYSRISGRTSLEQTTSTPGRRRAIAAASRCSCDGSA